MQVTRVLPAHVGIKILAVTASLTLWGCIVPSKETYLERGNQFLQAGETEAAILQYRKAVQKDHQYGEAHHLLGRAYLRAKRSQEAFAALTTAVGLLPDSKEAHADLGDLALSGYLADPRRPPRLYETANAMASALLARNPRSFEGLRIQAYLAMAEPNAALAADLFRQADQSKPGQPDVSAALIECLFASGETKPAEERALSLIQTNPGYGPGYDILYKHYREQGRDGEARDLLQLKVSKNQDESFYWIQLADVELAMGREDAAQAVIRSLLSAKPTPMGAFREAGDFFSRLRRWEEAIDVYRAGLNAKSADERDLEKGLVVAYLEAGNVEEAETLLDSILDRRPGDREARISRAALRLASGKPSEVSSGLAEFEALVKSEPQDAALRYQLGRALLDAGRAAEARQQFLKVLNLDNVHLGALRDLAAIAITDRDADLALEYAERALDVSPQDPSIRLIRTAAWALEGRHSEIRPELAKLVREFPTLYEVQIQLALLDLDQERFDEAASRFRKLYRPGSPDVRAVKGMLAVHHAREQHAEALALAERELRERPESRELLEFYATSAELAGKYTIATEALGRLARHEDSGIEIRLRLAKLYQEQGAIEKAIALLESAESRAPEDPMIAALLGSLYSDSGELDRAVASYRRSLALKSANVAVMNNLAYALAERGSDLSEAHALASSVVQQNPQNPHCADTLGFVYLKQGRVDSALQAFTGAVKKAPSVQLFRLHLGMALAAQGQISRARSELLLALNLDPTGTEAEAINALLRTIGGDAP